jgi:DNA replication protein DnaC
MLTPLVILRVAVSLSGGETFSDDVVAAAMIDRLVHPAEVLTLTGDSYRTRQRRELLAKEKRAGRD